ncbi:hypothetical protein AA0242T_1166 [Acetobacter aceti NRIC 0242]|uniref:Uncharacterized protein n=1 Tax=Acetobacter aceti NBRC 14818 TaxID=887700 RepID=A0AB33IKI3_ACEAC|nr:hypothetical protein [Acetobacter aceti]TCS33343.1 hypothetical protein EDC15_10724 [Acetobacter aceti NBRC 14818]BCK77510.1 hypothetical protein EMQ_3116 [Acetobacter aceti NBRC 14818]GAN56851.1 hypothetical protein Abac_010_125 [Acetobacter aceti NBRC 14818]GBO80464.1 hypothetical protein AA0242T_1166 [Acetobacter aceti NRIC 0242]
MDISTTATATVQNPIASSVSDDTRNGSSANKTTTAATTASRLNALPVINPASHIDPALGIVVVETYNTTGEVVDQYPTSHMMQQYSLYGLSQS